MALLIAALLFAASIYYLGVYARQKRAEDAPYDPVAPVEMPELRECPHCYGPIDPRASVCMHCRRDVEALRDASDGAPVVEPAAFRPRRPLTVAEWEEEQRRLGNA